MNKIYDILIKNLISTKDISVYLYDRAKLKSDIELNIRKTRSMVLYSEDQVFQEFINRLPIVRYDLNEPEFMIFIDELPVFSLDKLDQSSKEDFSFFVGNMTHISNLSDVLNDLG